MSEKLPEGWTCIGGDHWRHINEATADMHRPHGLWRAAVYGPDRQSKGEAETDRLNMIAGLEGRPSAALDEALALIESMVVERNELLHAADLAAERIDAAQKKIAAMEKRAEKYEASPDRASARMDAVVEKLDALGVPFCGGLVERIEALADRSADKDALIKLGVELRSVRTERDNLRSNAAFTSSCIDNARALRVERDAALAKVTHLEADVKTLTEAREYLERNIGELEDRRDADEAHVADLELELSEARLGHDAAEKALSQSRRDHDAVASRLAASEYGGRQALAKVADFELTLSEAVRDHYAAQERIADLEQRLADKTTFHRAAIAVVQRLKGERDNLRHTIATQQTSIDGLTAEASDKAPQLLRDSMRVTQEENARLRDEVSALTIKVITSEAYIARHNDANARTVQERNTCMERMELLRSDLAKMSESYVIIKGERDALLKERPAHRLAGVFAMQDQLVKAAENAERLTAEIAALTTRATAAEGYAQHLLAALNAVSGFRGMP